MKSKLSIILVAVCLSAGCTGPISERHHEEPPALLYSLDDKDRLIQMAEKRFGKLADADEILFDAVADGNWADYSEGGDKDRPENANSWGERRTINANRIEWLCRDKKAKELVTDKGIQIIGAKIVGILDLSYAEIPFPLSFWECDFTKEIYLYSSTMKYLAFKGSRTGSIMADGIKVEVGVFFKDGFIANGEVRFLGADIGKDFDCTNSEFVNKGRRAISADRMIIKGDVSLKDGFKANGDVGFPGATIGGDFVCNNGEFINEGGRAIIADRINVKGGVFLGNDFRANGEVRFLGAVIGGNLVCEKGEIINEGRRALSADGMNVKGNVYLRDGFKVEGLISFVSATISENFFWRDINLTENTVLDLRNAKVRVLWDDEKSWPEKGNLFLDGFVYENIGDYSPKDAKSRIEWLNRQDANQFQPGPYEQLAKVLEKIGHNEDAIKILIEKERQITKRGGFGWWGRFGRDIFDFTIGYGYRPWQALWSIGACIVIGFFIFWGGHKAGVIVPMEKDAYVSGQGGQLRERYPKFSFLGFSFLGALVYSIDMFVPVLDLRMAKYWIPDANKSGKFLRFIPVRGDFVRGYMWLHIIAGWILTTLFVVGLTGLVRT